MKKYFRHAFCLAVVLILPETVGAAWAPALDLTGLASNSDVVVVGVVGPMRTLGRVTVDTPAGRLPGQMRAGEIFVDHVLKGSPDLQSLQFRVAVTDRFVGYRSVAENTYGVFLLVRRDNQFEFVNRY